MKVSVLMILMVLFLGLAACGDGGDQADPPAESQAALGETPAQGAGHANEWMGKVVETMDSGGYTYILIDTGTEEVWVAGPETQVSPGQEVHAPKGMLMKDFTSKTLDRVFPELYFVGGIHFADGSGLAEPPVTGTGHTTADDARVEGVETVAGGFDVATILQRKSELSGQSVKLRGRVVKFTPNVMKTNWIHIQDGSGRGETADLTVTTDAVVNVGDLVVVEGVLSVDRDFGAGYRYAAIIEKAAVTKEE